MFLHGVEGLLEELAGRASVIRVDLPRRPAQDRRVRDLAAGRRAMWPGIMPASFWKAYTFEQRVLGQLDVDVHQAEAIEGRVPQPHVAQGRAGGRRPVGLDRSPRARSGWPAGPRTPWAPSGPTTCPCSRGRAEGGCRNPGGCRGPPRARSCSLRRRPAPPDWGRRSSSPCPSGGTITSVGPGS